MLLVAGTTVDRSTREVLGLLVASVGCRNMHVHELARGECTLHAQLRHTCSYTLSTCMLTHTHTHSANGMCDHTCCEDLNRSTSS